jgi:hypothetical protein
MKKNVSNLIKLMSVAMILAVIMPVAARAQGGKANFTGSWALNESKSTVPEGGGGMRGGREFSATQESNLLTRKSIGRDGTERVTKYTLDGKESVNTMGENQSKSVATWSADGKLLTIKTTAEFNGNAFTSTEVWSAPDAKTLSITRTSPGRDGGPERKMTMVYDKK